MALMAPQMTWELPQMLMGQPKLTLWNPVGAHPFFTPSSSQDKDGSVRTHPSIQGLLYLISLRISLQAGAELGSSWQQCPNPLTPHSQHFL